MIQPAPGFLEDAAAIGIEFEPGEVEKLGRYLALLLETNKTHNLTAITEPAEMWRRHVLDSLTLVGVLESSDSATQQRSDEAGQEDGDSARAESLRRSVTASLRVIDVGSGGGLPGVPLAIVMPHIRFTLLEATGKKAEFLKRVVAELGLANVRVVQARAERAGRADEHREKYDFAVARAVGPMSVIADRSTALPSCCSRPRASRCCWKTMSMVCR